MLGYLIRKYLISFDDHETPSQKCRVGVEARGLRQPKFTSWPHSLLAALLLTLAFCSWKYVPAPRSYYEITSNAAWKAHSLACKKFSVKANWDEIIIIVLQLRRWRLGRLRNLFKTAQLVKWQNWDLNSDLCHSKTYICSPASLGREGKCDQSFASIT